MHIAKFSNSYLPVINGVVRSINLFRTALSHLGHNVFVFAQDAGDYEDKEPFIFRYPSFRIPLTPDYPATIPISNFVDRLIPALKLDVIHTHHPFIIGQAAAAKAQEFGLPLVFTFHTQYQMYTHYFPIDNENIQEFMKSAVEYWAGEFIRRCEHVIVPSESMRQVLVESYGIEDRLTVIPTGLDLQPYQEASATAVRQERGWGDDFVIISVGRMAEEKNWDTLLKAFALVAADIPKLRLVLIGEGPHLEDLQELARDLALGERVEFVGRLPFESVPAYLKAADLFAFPSVTETQGLVTMEGMAAGLPIVAVDAVGTQDAVVNGVDGLLTDNDPAALAAGLRQVLDDRALYLRLKEQAIKKAPSFDIHSQAKRLVGVYEQAIVDRAAGLKVLVPAQKTFASLFDQTRLINLRQRE